MNAVKEHHTCEKPAEESQNLDKGYSIEPCRRQSKTHSIPEHIIQPVTEAHQIKQKKEGVGKPNNRRKLRHALKPNQKVLPEKKKKQPAGSLKRNKPSKL